MNETEKKFANINDQRYAENDEILPEYCMIAPCVDDVLNEGDGNIVCSNRS